MRCEVLAGVTPRHGNAAERSKPFSWWAPETASLHVVTRERIRKYLLAQARRAYRLRAGSTDDMGAARHSSAGPGGAYLAHIRVVQVGAHHSAFRVSGSCARPGFCGLGGPEAPAARRRPRLPARVPVGPGPGPAAGWSPRTPCVPADRARKPDGAGAEPDDSRPAVRRRSGGHNLRGGRSARDGSRLGSCRRHAPPAASTTQGWPQRPGWTDLLRAETVDDGRPPRDAGRGRGSMSSGVGAAHRTQDVRRRRRPQPGQHA